MKRLCERLSDDPALSQWWAGTGYRELLFHQSKRNPGDNLMYVAETDDPSELLVTAMVDLSPLKVDRPQKAVVDEVAKGNMRSLLDEVSKHLESPRPQSALVD